MSGVYVPYALVYWLADASGKIAGSNLRLVSDYYLPHDRQLVRWCQNNVT
jgi:hypothetical protein